MKVVLVGLGRMGRNHLRVLSSSPFVDLVAVCDLHESSKDLIENKSLPFLTSLSDVKKYAPDCVIIATPTETHFEVGDYFLRQGLNVFIEKPICSTADKGNELNKLARSKGLFLGVGHIERMNPAILKLNEVIKGGWLGDPVHFAFTRIGGYPATVGEKNNVLLDLAVHDLDVLNFLSGPMRVVASVGHSSFKPHTIDTAEILLTNDQGSSAAIHVNWVTPTKVRTLRVTGTRGVCFVDYILQTCELFGGNLGERGTEPTVNFKNIIQHYKSTDKITFGVEIKEPLKVQAEQLFNSLKGEESLLCTPEDAIFALNAAEEAIEGANLEIVK